MGFEVYLPYCVDCVLLWVINPLLVPKWVTFHIEFVLDVTLYLGCVSNQTVFIDALAEVLCCGCIS